MRKLQMRAMVYILAFMLPAVVVSLLVPAYRDWVAGGTGVLFVAVTAFLIGYYRNSYPLTGPSLAPWQVGAMLLIALSPIVVAIVQFVLSGSATYALTVVAAVFAAGLLFVVAPMALGRKLGRRACAEGSNC